MKKKLTLNQILLICVMTLKMLGFGWLIIYLAFNFKDNPIIINSVGVLYGLVILMQYLFAKEMQYIQKEVEE